MYICICSSFTDSELKHIVNDDPEISMDDLRYLDVAVRCNKCSETVETMLNDFKNINEQQQQGNLKNTE